MNQGTSSGTASWRMDFAMIMTEAFERIGIIDTAPTAAQAASAMRSLELCLSSLAGKGVQLWKVDRVSVPLLEGDFEIATDAGCVDVHEVYVRQMPAETELSVPIIAWSDYALLHDKQRKGRPLQAYIKRTRAEPVIVLWPVTNQSDLYELVYWRMLDVDDAGSMTLNPDISRRWQDWICADLAYRLSVKYAPERTSLLNLDLDRAFEGASIEDGAAGIIKIVPDLGHLSRRRRGLM